MDTKEAIEFIKDEVMFAEDNYDEDIIKKRNQVITLLQQGEEYKKYKLMWKEISQGRYALIEFDNEGYEKKGTKSFNEIEQKYFPKDEKDSYFYECTPQTAPHLKKVLFKKANQEYKEGKE